MKEKRIILQLDLEFEREISENQISKITLNVIWVLFEGDLVF